MSVKPSTPRSGTWKTARPSRTRTLYVPTTTLRCTTLSTTTPSYADGATLTVNVDGRNGTSAPCETVALGLTATAHVGPTTVGSAPSAATTSPPRSGVKVSV